MSRRQALQQHLQQLHEIRGILNAMKNLALMETHKLARFLDAQHQVVRTIETAATDFMQGYPITRTSQDAHAVVVLLGSERGFCGDLNNTLLERLTTETQATASEPQLIAVGRRLGSQLQDHPRLAATIDGPNVAEEVSTVLQRLVTTISTLQTQAGFLNLFVLYHDKNSNTPLSRQLLPPFQSLPPALPASVHPPLLNLPPDVFFADLVDHYLFAALHEMIYTSLMAENHRRVEHMDAAVSHLDENVSVLEQRKRRLRQEEITEEIEVILLSAEGENRSQGF